MNQPTTKNWSAPIKAKYENETRYFDNVEDADKWLEEMEAKDLATTEPPPTEARSKPRTYWVLLRNDLYCDAIYRSEERAMEQLKYLKKHNISDRSLIKVQEVPNE